MGFSLESRKVAVHGANRPRPLFPYGILAERVEASLMFELLWWVKMVTLW